MNNSDPVAAARAWADKYAANERALKAMRDELSKDRCILTVERLHDMLALLIEQGKGHYEVCTNERMLTCIDVIKHKHMVILKEDENDSRRYS